MIEFLSSILEKAGFVAMIYTASMAAMALALRVLWNQTRADQRQRLEDRDRHAAKLEALIEKHAIDGEDCEKRIAALQEKRVEEARHTTERVLQHVNAVDHTMQRQTATIEVLVRQRSGR